MATSSPIKQFRKGSSNLPKTKTFMPEKCTPWPVPGGQGCPCPFLKDAGSAKLMFNKCV